MAIEIFLYRSKSFLEEYKMAKDTAKELRNKVIYQIFTRNYKEGTFQAIEKDLERIKALGVDYIYLLPVQPSGEVHRKGSMGSPYAIKDYRAVDPVQGTMEDFIHLTESIHKAGLKVMLDVVYNHTSPDSWLSENHPEWFYHKADGNFGNRIGEWWDVIDLDYSNMDLWDYQIDTLKMWAQYVDGFRCDVAPILPIDFWIRARKEIAEIKEDFIWLGESVEPHFISFCRQDGIEVLSDGELYQAFDILYDYDIQHYLTMAMDGVVSLERYVEAVEQQEVMYPSNYCKLRFLENHDRNRAATVFPDETVLKNMTAWIYFTKGTTMIYAGQENGEKHHPTLFDLDTVTFDTGIDYSGFLKALADMKKNQIFAKGNYKAQVIGKNKDIIFATREMKDNKDGTTKKCVGLFSTSGCKQSVRIELPDGVYKNMIDGKEVDIFEKTVAFEGEPIVIML